MTMAPEDHTQQIPQGGYYSQSAPPAPPAPPTPPLGEGSRPAPKRDNRFGQTVGVALLAAVLASGGTYAATQLGGQSTATGSTPAATATTNPNQNSSPTVVQGNASAPDWTAVAAAVSPSVVGIDVSTDLAVIKLTNGPKDLTPITLGDSEGLKVGDPAMAVGNPLGLSGTVTTGIISALNRPVSTGASSEAPQ